MRPDDPKDASFLVATLNDPRVYTFLESPPFPYLPEHAASFIRDARAECDRILRDVDAGREFVDGCPFRFIRQVVKNEDEDGETNDVLIGDISITRYAFYELPPGSEERREAQERNKALPVGSGDVVWGIGSMFHPSFFLFVQDQYSNYLCCLFCMNLQFIGSSQRLPISLSPRPRHHDHRRTHTD